MLYDVFISYSRKDIDEAERLCQELDAAGVKYWIDRNIHGSANFLSEITRNIRQCKVVIFIASNNSANSEWTQKEILYALKRQKKIIPFRIGEFSFDTNDELDFVFSNVQWLENREHVVRDVCELCGIDYAAQKQHHAEQKAKAEEQERIAKERAAQAEAQRREEERRKAEEEARRMAEEQSRLREEKIRRNEAEKQLRREQRQACIEKIKKHAGAIVASILLIIGVIAGFVVIKDWAAERKQQQIEAQIKADSIRVATERAAERAEAERIAAEKAAKEKAEQERIAKEKAEAERKAAEKAAKEKAEQERIAKQKAEAERIAKEKAEQEARLENEYRLSGKGRNGVYKVGDYYNDGTKEGVVFYVDATGKHGKIVSLDEVDIGWCTFAQYYKEIVVGATSKTDGKANTDKVMARADSTEYPAFVWCRNMGKDWYLPAEEELSLLLLDYLVYKAVSKTLESRGATKLKNLGEDGYYWSSTEYAGNPELYARYVVMVYCSRSNDKYANSYVRAVSAF